MVEDRITDSRRIAQLLASELSGLATGPLGEVSVVDADPDATPSEDGTVAYNISYEGREIGTVRLYAASVAVELQLDGVDQSPDSVDEAPVSDRVTVDRQGPQRLTITLEDGASVKEGVDLLRYLLN
jgi:hypothetical protein